MGMAASQARFLGLTGRKSNTEYQGQQVNQQRSALANESAGLFNQMTALKVPTPPSSIDYYSSRYQFNNSGDTSKNFSIQQILSTDGDDAVVRIDYSQSGIDATKGSTSCDGAEKIVSGDDVSYKFTTEKQDGTSVEHTLSTPIAQNADGSYKQHAEVIKDIQNGRASDFYEDRDAKDEKFYTTKINGTTHIFSSYDLEDAFKDGVTPDSIPSFTEKQTSTKQTYDAKIKFAESDETGRYTSMQFYSVSAEEYDKLPEELKPFIKKESTAGTEELNGAEVSLSIGKVDDSEGYEKAMKEYEYEKMLYDRAIDDINSRTEIIQQQDKGLELKLKQLDTEQKAIQTEMEAVQKVIQKNVETTFKTFG